MLAANKVDDIESGNKLIKKYGKLLKIGKLFKLGNLKDEILFQPKKHLGVKHVFTLAFINMRIKIKAAYFLGK